MNLFLELMPEAFMMKTSRRLAENGRSSKANENDIDFLKV